MTNAEAQKAIDSRLISYKGRLIVENLEIDDASEIKVADKTVRAEKKFICFKFYKPRGFQSSLNKKVADNIAAFFPDITGLAIAGRLDKDSEGLLLVSDNGKWIQQVCDPKSEKEKEYIVELDKTPDAEFLKKFSAGIKLGDGMTKPCTCIHLKDVLIKVILTEGRNRQIRRMCHYLGYKVLNLKRVRIESFNLDVSMRPGEIEAVSDFGKI